MERALAPREPCPLPARDAAWIYDARMRPASASAVSWLGLTLAVALVAGCGDEEETFAFDGDDMRDAIEGTWTGAVTSADGSTAEMTMTLAYTAPAKSPACGNRELGANPALRGALCTTESTIGLEGTMSIADDEPADVAGSFIVSGSQLQGGYLELQAAGDSKLGANAEVDTEGARLTGQLTSDGRRFELARK